MAKGRSPRSTCTTRQPLETPQQGPKRSQQLHFEGPSGRGQKRNRGARNNVATCTDVSEGTENQAQGAGCIYRQGIHNEQGGTSPSRIAPRPLPLPIYCPEGCSEQSFEGCIGLGAKGKSIGEKNMAKNEGKMSAPGAEMCRGRS